MIRSCSILSQATNEIVRACSHASGSVCRALVLQLALLANFGFDGHIPAALRLGAPCAVVVGAWASWARITRKPANLVSLLLVDIKGCSAEVAMRSLCDIRAGRRLLSRRRLANVHVFFACNFAVPFLLARHFLRQVVRGFVHF